MTKMIVFLWLKCYWWRKCCCDDDDMVILRSMWMMNPFGNPTTNTNRTFCTRQNYYPTIDHEFVHRLFPPHDYSAKTTTTNTRRMMIRLEVSRPNHDRVLWILCIYLLQICCWCHCYRRRRRRCHHCLMYHRTCYRSVSNS